MIKSIQTPTDNRGGVSGLFEPSDNIISPLFSHALHEFLFWKLALCCCPELPGYEEDTDAGWVQSQVVTELLDPINADLIVIMGILLWKKESID